MNTSMGNVGTAKERKDK